MAEGGDIPVTVPSQTVVTCEGCETEFNVSWYCTDCPASLCDQCKEQHGANKFLARHAVVPRSERVLRSHDKGKLCERCKHHPEKDVITFCTECQVPCCVVCHKEHHQKHIIELIEDTYLAKEKSLNEFVQKLQKKRIPSIQSRESIVSEKKKKTNTNFTKAENDVNYFRQTLKDKVDKSCDRFISQLRERANQCMSGFDLELQELQEDRVNVGNIVDECCNRIREGGLRLLQYNPDPPLEGTTSPGDTVRPIFVPMEDISESITNNAGKILFKTDKSADSEEVSQLSKKNANEKAGLPRAKYFRPKIDIEVVGSFDAEIKAKSVVPVCDDKAWLCHFSSERIYLYDRGGSLVKSVTVQLASHVWDIALDLSGQIIVCNDDKKVRLVSAKGQVTTLIDTAPFAPRSICITSQGEMVVCLKSDTLQQNGNHVAVYSGDGKRKLHEIKPTDSKGRDLFTFPYCVIQHGNDFCVVNHADKVISVDRHSKVNWIYDGTQAKLKEKFKPIGICEDKYRNMFISEEGNYCVHYIDHVGSLIGIVLTQEQHGVESPWGIGFDIDCGKIWVGSVDSSEVKIFQYKLSK